MKLNLESDHPQWRKLITSAPRGTGETNI